MAVEFIRMKLWKTDGTTVLLSGSVVLQPDGAIDFFGDAAAHAGEIVAAIESFDALQPIGTLASVTGGSRCLQVDKIRMGTVDSLTPMILRPGQPAAIVREAADTVRVALRRELAAFRAVRAAMVSAMAA